jgi:L-aspartate oxidase
MRDSVGLRRAQARLMAMRESGLRTAGPRELTRTGLEARNLHAVAEAMVQAALGREESRGAHYRVDFPERAGVAQHSILQHGGLRFVQN